MVKQNHFQNQAQKTGLDKKWWYPKLNILFHDLFKAITATKRFLDLNQGSWKSNVFLFVFLIFSCVLWVIIPLQVQWPASETMLSDTPLGSTFLSKILWYSWDFMIPCTYSNHPVTDGAKQPQNKASSMFHRSNNVLYLCHLHFCICKIRALLKSSSCVSSVHRSFSFHNLVACLHAFFKNYFFSSVVSSMVISHKVHFGSNNDRWRDLTLMYLGVHVE